MPDEADLANDHMEREIEQRILEVQRAKPTSAYSCGQCRNCGDSAPGAAFCDANCRADFDARERSRKRAGL